MMSKFHYYFLLPSSPMPVIASLSSFNLLFSMMIFLKFHSNLTFFVGLILISMACLFWFMSYSNEMNLEGNSSFNLESGLKMSMILFISSEVLFFFSFFWSYFHFFLSPSMETGLNWPPLYLEMFDYSNVPLINTLVLLSSGMFLTMSHHFMMEYNMKNCCFFMMITIILGVIFTCLQFMEYCSSFFSISDSTFGTSFFMLTGFHGIHVLIGTLFILVSLVRMPHLTCAKNFCISMELSAWYWHFVDVVWIFLYFFIYYMNF